MNRSRLVRQAGRSDGAGGPVKLGRDAVGVTICEDMWNDRFFWPRRRYGMDPVEGLAAVGVGLMLNLSASPFSAGKADVRRNMLSAMARRHGVPFVCVNLAGGNDQLIFDGRSLAARSAQTDLDPRDPPPAAADIVWARFAKWSAEQAEGSGTGGIYGKETEQAAGATPRGLSR